MEKKKQKFHNIKEKKDNFIDGIKETFGKIGKKEKNEEKKKMKKKIKIRIKKEKEKKNAFSAIKSFLRMI